jgi:hypothetical protein
MYVREYNDIKCLMPKSERKRHVGDWSPYEKEM